jgi:hypothetical protein
MPWLDRATAIKPGNTDLMQKRTRVNNALLNCLFIACFRPRERRTAPWPREANAANYDHAPRKRCIERRGCSNQGPSIGVGVGPGGVDIGAVPRW